MKLEVGAAVRFRQDIFGADDRRYARDGDVGTVEKLDQSAWADDDEPPTWALVAVDGVRVWVQFSDLEPLGLLDQIAHAAKEP